MAGLTDRLHYLTVSGSRYWLDTRPNLRRKMEDRRQRFREQEDVRPAIRERLSKLFAPGSLGGVHLLAGPGDAPDDWALRLVLLPPNAGHSKAGASQTIERAAESSGC